MSVIYIFASSRETIGWFLQNDRGILKQDRRYFYWQLKERHASDSKLCNCARFSNWQVNMSSDRKKLSSLQNLETTGKYRKWLGKHDVEHYQMTRVIRKNRAEILEEVLQDMVNARMFVTENYEFGWNFWKWQVNVASGSSVVHMPSNSKIKSCGFFSDSRQKAGVFH